MKLHERGRSPDDFPDFSFDYLAVSFTFAPSMWLFVVFVFSDVCLHDVAHVTCCISLYLVAALAGFG